jgi:hypothetical protein
MQGDQEVPPAELPMQYAAAQGVSVRDVEVEVVHSDGLRLNLLEYATPLYDEQAQVRGCLGVFVDITRRKTAEHRLAIQYTVARALAESTGSDEASVKVLQAMCEATGWEFGALWQVDTDAGLLHNVSIWQSPQLRADLFAAETQTITFAVGQGLPGRVLAAGRPIWIPDVMADDIFLRTEAAAKSGLHGALAFPIRSKGEISGVLECFSRNIQQPTADVIELLDAIGNQLGVFMERKRAEEALRLSLRKTRELYEVSQNISLVRTPAETLQVLLASSYLNHATRASVAIFNANWLEGHRPESCTIVTAWNRDPETALHIGEQMTLEEYGVVETYAGYEPLVIDDIRNDPRVSESMRGRLLTLGTASSILFPLIASGEWYGMLSLHFKFTKMMQAEDIRHLRGLVDEAATAIYNLRSLEAEARARREAERANSLKMKFLAMISHELRTPLTSIKGFATTLLADDVTWEPESQRDFIQTMNAEADKLSDLIEQLLDLSRLEAGAIRIATQVETWDNILTTAKAQLDALTVDHPLIVDAPANLPSLKVDAARVAQVITNLVNNATKYSPPQTVITLAAAQLDERYVKVCVSDEGPGIPLAARSRAFEAFQQLHHEKTDSKGAGLGLAICRGLVEAHGGRIWIEDRAGPGTTICFTLPIC